MYSRAAACEGVTAYVLNNFAQFLLERAAQAPGPATAKLDASERARGLLERVLASDRRNADAAGALAAVTWHLAGGRGNADSARAEVEGMFEKALKLDARNQTNHYRFAAFLRDVGAVRKAKEFSERGDALGVK